MAGAFKQRLFEQDGAQEASDGTAGKFSMLDRVLTRRDRELGNR
jgi:hypothetical protein